jgi:hypothetical protein
MTDRNADAYAAFRLNLEQQHKRAKDLLKAAKAGEAEALQRLRGAGLTAPATPKLAQAQHCIARELRFENWAALKRHIGEMERARRAPAPRPPACGPDARAGPRRCMARGYPGGTARSGHTRRRAAGRSIE